MEFADDIAISNINIRTLKKKIKIIEKWAYNKKMELNK
jgi:hypothetical protein